MRAEFQQTETKRLDDVVVVSVCVFTGRESFNGAFDWNVFNLL